MGNETKIMEGDKVYYKQLSQHLLESLHRSITFGELGSVDSGNFFLCRHEDRIMWIQVSINYHTQMIWIIKLNIRNKLFDQHHFSIYRFWKKAMITLFIA